MKICRKTQYTFAILVVFLVVVGCLSNCANEQSLKENREESLLKQADINKDSVKKLNSMISEPKSVVEITAHRGDCSSTPENTLIAVKYAIRGGADYVEIDVQETSDCKLVVLHDDNINRTTGIQKSVWDCTFKELSQMDAGSWFNKKYDIARIPTFEEVLILCQNKIKLNIEIKADKHNHIVEKTVALIEKYNFEENCYVTSSSYHLLEQISNRNSLIKTGLICSNPKQIDYDSDVLDMLSLSVDIVTQKIVDDLHEKEKPVHVWTVNSESEIQRMIDIGVDNIISNNPNLVKEMITQKN